MFDRDCPEEGQQCFPNLPGCDLVEMAKIEKANQISDGPSDWRTNRNAPANFRFCGTGWDDAADNCSLERHCPDFVCADPGLQCFIGLSFYAGAEFCNAYEINQGKTRAPTIRPTSSPSLTPTPVSSKCVYCTCGFNSRP